jgi:transposase
VLSAHRLAVLQIVPLIIQLNETVAEYDRQIAEQMAQHSDAALFESFLGAGPALAPRLAVAFGTDRERFASAADMQQLSGIAPVMKRSGKTCCIQRRLGCPKFLHQTFHEYADHSRFRSKWARAFYRMLRARGMRHHAAIRSLAFKWQRILFRCWKTRQPYDEAQHLRQLELRNSPLLAHLEKTSDT